MKDLRDLYGYLNNTAYEEIMKNFKEGVKSWLVNGLQICTKQRSLLCD